jgi:hypothetical protein
VDLINKLCVSMLFEKWLYASAPITYDGCVKRHYYRVGRVERLARLFSDTYSVAIQSIYRHIYRIPSNIGIGRFCLDMDQTRPASPLCIRRCHLCPGGPRGILVPPILELIPKLDLMYKSQSIILFGKELNFPLLFPKRFICSRDDPF